jgi:hypothetical protein
MTNGGKGGGGGGGAVYMVVVGDRGNGTNYAVADLEPVEFMGLRCLKGRFFSIDPRHFMADRVACFPVEKVLLITEYESMAAYQEAARRHREAFPRRKPE